jgi:hypothetical protein
MQTMLFGGSSNSHFGYAETWVWDGAAWTQKTPLNSPPGGYWGAMADDGQELIFFGGFNLGSGSFSNDTWGWDGTNWTLKSPATRPPVRRSAGLAYDKLHQQTVLFGGRDSSGNYLTDTWVWDGANWTQKFPLNSPPGTVALAIAYDEQRQNVVLFNGYISDAQPSSTWTWDGTNWTQLSPAGTPSPRYGVDSISLAYDSANRRTILFGGGTAYGGTLGDTWAWDGVTWSQLSPLSSPPNREQTRLAYDAARQQTVLYGGQGCTGYCTDMWMLGSTAPATAPVSVTVPSGVEFFFNGQSYTGPQTIPIAPGGYALYAASPQTIAAGTQAVFASWSDGGTQSHTVTVPAGGLSITGNFTTSYLLTTVANPSAGGTVSGGGYYTAGSTANVTESPNANYAFSNWSGACAGSGACSVVMNAPATVAGNFVSTLAQYTVNVPVDVQFTFNGVSYTGTQTISVNIGTYTLATTTPQATAAGTQKFFLNWSDGGAISHSVTLVAGAQAVTGTFQTQYLLTGIANPLAGGNVMPPAGGPYFDAGSTLTVSEVAAQGYQFAYWSGGCTGSAPACQLVLNAPTTVTGNFAPPSMWVQLGPPTAPSARTLTASASDPVHGVVVLFGGSIDNQDQVYTNDTWVWNGTTWTQMHPATSPPARVGAAMAWDPALGQIMLFGGLSSSFANLNDTWVWDGANWTQKLPVQSPSARRGARMAFDGTWLVLYGGLSSAGFQNDTWVWNPLNNSWQQRSPAQAPPARWYPGMTYDSAHGQIVLFGGQGASQYNDTWVWNGTTWTQKLPANSPLARSNAMLAFDAAIQQIVLFSGLPLSGHPTFPDEVWFWDGNNWVESAETPSPSRRFDSALAYDDTRRQIVLFGGDTGSPGTDVPMGDTWVFGNNVTQQTYTLTLAANPAGAGALTATDSAGQPGPNYRAGSVVTVTASANALTPFAYWSGACTGSGACTVTITGNLTVAANYTLPLQWTELGPANSPSSRTEAAMSFDATRGEVVLFGGLSGNFLNDTWSWDGTNWTLRNTAGPGGRELTAMAYDPVHQQMILFGGAMLSGQKLNDTWIWDGASSTWSQQHPATQPSSREAAMLGWDGSKLILFGGDGGAAGRLNDTWTWNGSNWIQLSPANSPSIRSDAAFTYDAARNQLVLFGGVNSQAFLGDTWVWNGNNWIARSPEVSPSARDNLEMLNYDPVIQQCVLFAGYNQPYPPEVWLWDGNNWTEVPEAPSPEDRDFHSMVFDQVHQQLVLFGGLGNDVYNDTWVFANNAVQQYRTLTVAINPAGAGTVTAHELTGAVNQPGPSYRAGSRVILTASSSAAQPFEYWSGPCSGVEPCKVTMNSDVSVTANYPAKPGWVELGPNSAPPPRNNRSMAFDSGRGEAVLFGGYTVNDTWIWDGSNWNPRNPTTPPPARGSGAMAYDPAHRVTVLFGGDSGLGVTMGDTWIWDGAANTWTQAAPAHSPSPRTSAQMAWDGTRLMLFGGQTAGGPSAETWAWNGSDWTLLATASAPPARSAHAMAYDPIRLQVVLFGGQSGANSLGDTWVWNGSAWQPISTPNTLTARSYSVMAFQGAIQQMVLFSGVGSVLAADTWRFDGYQWKQSTETVAPAIQWNSAMVYDSVRQQTLLLSHYAGDLGETWIYSNNAIQQYATLALAALPASGGTVRAQGYTSSQVGPTYRVGSNVLLTAAPALPQEFEYWSGAIAGSNPFCVLILNSNQSVTGNFGAPLSWLQLNPATNASPKRNLQYENPISMTFDAARQQVIYFGGNTGNQTWVWNGSTWTQKTPAHSPPARSGHALAYDAARQRVVLFGGINATVALNDTWTWDGIDWTLADPGNGPARRMNHAMAYDRVRQEIVLFGGCDETLHFYSDTWGWNGTAWVLKLAANGPPPRTDFGMVFDPVAGEIVISGGIEGQHDTWTWNGSAWSQANPTQLPPAVGGFMQMAYDEHLERTILLMDNYPNAPQTWMWNGSDWRQLSPTQNPTPRSAGGVVWDGVRGQVILFGGDTNLGGLSDTWALAPPTVILTLQSVTVSKDASGNYLVTTTLKNTGNTAALAVNATAATIIGLHTVTSNTFTAGQFSTVTPGATGAITTKFPAGTGSGVYSFTIQGFYGSVNVSAGSWSAAYRVLVLL